MRYSLGTGGRESRREPPTAPPAMTTATLHAQLEAARAVVNAINYNAIDWQ